MIDPSRSPRSPARTQQPTDKQAAQRRLMMIGGAAGGFLLVLLIVVLAAGGGGKRKKAAKKTEDAAAARRVPPRVSRYEDIDLRSAPRASRPTGPETLANLMNQPDQLPPAQDNTAGYLAVARLAMAQRNLDEARRCVYAAVAKAKSAEETREAERVEDLLKSLDRFWKAARAGAEGKPPPLGQVSPEQALAWAQRGLKAEAADLAIGAFLAIDAQGDRLEARVRLERAGDAGKALLPELDVPPPAASLEIPPAAR